MQKLQTEFITKIEEVSEERFYDMLGAVPPQRMAYGGFLVGEPMDHQGPNGAARYQLFIHEGDKFYYGGISTIEDFELFLIPVEESSYESH